MLHQSPAVIQRREIFPDILWVTLSISVEPEEHNAQVRLIPNLLKQEQIALNLEMPDVYKQGRVSWTYRATWPPAASFAYYCSDVQLTSSKERLLH